MWREMFSWSLNPLNNSPSCRSSSLIGDMYWDLIGDNDDHLVPEPQDTTRMAWEASGFASGITCVAYGNTVAGGDDGNYLPKANSTSKTQCHKAQGATEEMEGLGHVSENSELIFETKTSLESAGAQTTHTMAVEKGISNTKVREGAAMSMDGSLYDDEIASELSSSCHFPLINAQTIEANSLFEGEQIVVREDDLLEHSWDNIGNLSSLEDMDNMFQDPLFPTDTPDVDDVSPIPNLFPGMQCSLPESTQQSVMSQTNLQEDGQNGFARKKIEGGACLPFKDYKDVISQGPSMKQHVSKEVDGAYDTKLMVEEASSEAATLNQLRAVVMQLNIRTRICIRDVFYRLARSAMQRHADSEGGNNKIGCGEYLDSRLGLKTHFLTRNSRYEGSKLVERETNPIDRSIAELLFCKQTPRSSSGASLSPSLSSFDGRATPTTKVTSGFIPRHDAQPAIIPSSSLPMVDPSDSVKAADRIPNLQNVQISTSDVRTNHTSSDHDKKVNVRAHPQPAITSGKGLPCSSDPQNLALVPSYSLQRNHLHSCLEIPTFGFRPAANGIPRYSTNPDGTFKGRNNLGFKDLRCRMKGTAVNAEHAFFI